MSDERIIAVADLTYIHRSLTALNEGLGQLDNHVGHVGSEVAVTKQELAILQQAFSDFVAADARSKELALAEMRVVKIRQELETKYGYYAVVRRHATGILQAADVSLVRQETLATATEELMLAAPGYWLAPALVALSAWLRNDRSLAEKAVAEATRRDDEKTSLCFALVCRRAGRLSGCRTWLDRYFAMQDPACLDRQAVVLVDALAGGVFGTEVRRQCSTRMEEWVKELSQQAGFIAEQRRQWHDALLSKTPAHDHSSHYPYLRKHSPTGQQVNQALNAVAVHGAILTHIKGIFEGEITPSPTLEAAVDELLDKLVSRFDDEELPLRSDERRNQLIIDEDGNRAAAQARFDLESKALDAQVSFTQLLTNAAMHPETSHASLATQRLAIAVSRQWITDAHADLTASIRSEMPAKIALRIEEWAGETTTGADEAELLTALRAHLDKRKQQELDRVRLEIQHYLALGVGVLLVVAALPSIASAPGQSLMLFALGAAAIGWFFVARSQLGARRQKVEDDFARLSQQYEGILRACLAEVVEFRREFARLDAVAAQVGDFLEKLSGQEHMQSTHDTARQIMGGATS